VRITDHDNSILSAPTGNHIERTQWLLRTRKSSSLARPDSSVAAYYPTSSTRQRQPSKMHRFPACSVVLTARRSYRLHMAIASSPFSTKAMTISTPSSPSPLSTTSSSMPQWASILHRQKHWSKDSQSVKPQQTVESGSSTRQAYPTSATSPSRTPVSPSASSTIQPTTSTATRRL